MTDTETAKHERVVDARLAAIIARFGEVLSPEQLEGVRKRIGRTLEVEADLKRTDLKNSDEPEIVFTPFRGAS